MLRHVIRVLCVLALGVRAASGQGAGLPETLSAEDRELVRLALESSLKERVGWSADSAVLLDSTRQLCDGLARRDCLDPTQLYDLTPSLSFSCTGFSRSMAAGPRYRSSNAAPRVGRPFAAE
jgi:hypothetical protein